MTQPSIPIEPVAEAIRKAEILLEALDFIREFRHRVVVIKLGGSVLEVDETLDATLQDVVFMETVGLRPILIHGGGKAITEACARAGLQTQFVRGRRYTDEATLEIVADVLAATINTDLVERIERLGGSALGLHHLTRPVLFGRKLELEEDGQRLDIGRVGEVVRVETGPLHKLATAGIIPVLPSLAIEEGTNLLLNVNADTVAAAVAESLKAEKLVFISDTPGILKNAADPSTLLPSLTETECRRLMADGVLSGGMIPKVEACLSSLRAGVGKIHLVDGRVRHSLLLEIYTRHGVGTEIVL
jgi:acetylglutamate kinase